VLASVCVILFKVIRPLPQYYEIPDPLPWGDIAGPLGAAEDSLARLDQQLAKSPIRDGWVSRVHFSDACASLGLDGALVHVDDLVLHDANLDVRAPTHALTRAHAVLRARRRIADAKPDWALSRAGIASLRGGGGSFEGTGPTSRDPGLETELPDDQISMACADEAHGGLQAQLAAALAAADFAISKANRTLNHGLAGDASSPARAPARDPAFYDLDWNEDQRLAAWRTVIDRTRDLPPTLAAAIAADAWTAIDPLQHAHGLGRLFVAALLRERGKTRCHLPCLNTGLKAIPYERRCAQKSAARLAVQLEALAAAADIGLKDHDRWLTARTLLVRKLAGRRATSRLPALIDYVLARPVVSARMIADELGVAPRTAQDLVAELGLREATGRGRYRAWGIF
jgi:hypothetical protein